MSNSALTQQVKDRMMRAHFTPDGASWALMALDPMHDSNLAKVGVPNASTGMSSVYKITREISISKPATFAAGAWDAHVAVLGSCRLGPGSSATQEFQPVGGITPPTPTGMSIAAATPVPLEDGFVVVSMAPTGQTTFDPDPARTAATLAYSGINIDEYIEPGSKVQIAGFAFEVHNTTAPLNKSGSVTCYRFENNEQTFCYRYSDNVSTPVWQGLPTVQRNLPPNSLARAKAMGGLTWEAKLGALVSGDPGDLNQPPRQYGPNHWLLNGPDGYSYTNTSTVVSYTLPCLLFDVNTSGAYFNGLSEETTFTVSLVLYLEMFPDTDSPVLALSSPSPSLDYKALQLVTEIMRDLNPGVPVTENAIGDFFRGVANAIHRIAKPVRDVISLIPDKRAQKVADTIGRIDQVVAKVGKKKATRKSKPKGTPGIRILPGPGRIVKT